MILTSLLLSILIITQGEIIQLKDYYKGYGVIFDEEVPTFGKLEDEVARFKPSIEEVMLAEDIFFKEYNHAIEKDERLEGYPPAKNVKKRYWKYYRQYYGYTSKSGNRHIYIHLLNFQNRRQAKRLFENWEFELIIGFGDFYERNVRSLIANLDKEALRFH